MTCPVRAHQLTIEPRPQHIAAPRKLHVAAESVMRNRVARALGLLRERTQLSGTPSRLANSAEFITSTTPPVAPIWPDCGGISSVSGARSRATLSAAVTRGAVSPPLPRVRVSTGPFLLKFVLAIPWPFLHCSTAGKDVAARLLPSFFCKTPVRGSWHNLSPGQRLFVNRKSKRSQTGGSSAVSENSAL